MPVVHTSGAAAAPSTELKQQPISRMTSVVVEPEGIRQLRGSLHIPIERDAGGGWGDDGKAAALEASVATFGERTEGTSS